MTAGRQPPGTPGGNPRPRSARWRAAPPLFVTTAAAIALSLVASPPPAVPGPTPGGAQSFDPEGKELYEAGCAFCHGLDGAGPDTTRVTLEIPTPDFTDCRFASREPDADWIAISHEGGPIRGFSETMPAFGEAYSVSQLQAIVDYIRTFCSDPSWPPGEFNLPRALITEKAYPEDEFVWTVGADLEGPTAVSNWFLYERRIGARHQIEFRVPLLYRETTSGDVTAGEFGLGDAEVAFKSAVWFDSDAGTIVSLGADVELPTGSESKGLGEGSTKVEPFVAVGQILSANTFLQALGGVGFPFGGDETDPVGNLRLVLGGTGTTGRFGRSWTPMAELLVHHVFAEDATTEWTLIPQLQVSLNARQHILANVGVGVPLDHTDVRSTQLLVYFLWDWFDGGLFDGW